MVPPALATPSVGNRRLLGQNLLRRFGQRLKNPYVLKYMGFVPLWLCEKYSAE